MKFYETLAKNRDDDAPLRACVESTVKKLIEQNTSVKRPGILLGKIQSGKTRAFLGVTALAFDRGYDVAVVLTKGTKSLARQTLSRIRSDFRPFIKNDEILVYDIMALPSLTGWELERKLIFVVKKEDDNLDRLLEAFQKDYPELRSKKLLLIDDEADVATVTYRKKDGNIEAGVIQRQIDELRNLVKELDFLMVTATPYALYLQPEEEAKANGSPLFLPKRPAFTEILPIHSAYVGGDYYFEKSADPNSPAHYFYKDVPVPERDALKKPDGRRLKLDLILSEKNAAVLCGALTKFIVGGVIRRLQQAADNEYPLKYSFLFHTEHQRQSHDWQQSVVAAVQNALMVAAEKNGKQFEDLMQEAFADLQCSLKLGGKPVPAFAEVKVAVRDSLLKKHLMVTTVNSDQELNSLLDEEDGQLKLRTPLNVFIGGQILDRGITIANLIGFYYGRNPQKFQQDTVLQHSRMYGARSQPDLAVTRFYAPLHIYQTMKKIHEFDAALREAFEKGAHNRGVYFIQKDAANRLVPCSPNKLLFSKLTAIRPGGRLLPVGFQTVAKTTGTKALGKLDDAIHAILKAKPDEPMLVDIQTAIDLLSLAFSNLEFGEDAEDERKGHSAALEHLSRQAKNADTRGKVWLIAARDRDVVRVRQSGRFSDSPDTKQDTAAATQRAIDVPALIMLRQNGAPDNGWRGLPFWWPVIVAPERSVTSIFAAEAPDD